MSYTVSQWDATQAAAAMGGLGALLRDCVEGGASIGFMLPLPEAEVRAYWQGVVQAMQAGTRLLLVASQAGQAVGAVQLGLEARTNGLHRAEVQKLLVHRAARRQGIGRALLHAAEQAALAHGRTLLMLDTRQDSPAELLYQTAGYTLIGAMPGHARDPDGPLAPTTFYYRWLASPSES